MITYLERFEVPGVGSFGIEDRKNSSYPPSTGQRYRLLSEEVSIGNKDTLKEARKAIIHYAYHRLMLEKSDLLSRLDTVNHSMEVMLEICTAKISEFQVELKE